MTTTEMTTTEIRKAVEAFKLAKQWTRGAKGIYPNDPGIPGHGFTENFFTEEGLFNPRIPLRTYSKTDKLPVTPSH